MVGEALRPGSFRECSNKKRGRRELVWEKCRRGNKIEVRKVKKSDVDGGGKGGGVGQTKIGFRNIELRGERAREGVR